jgi:protein-disulfide isomerase
MIMRLLPLFVSTLLVAGLAVQDRAMAAPNFKESGSPNAPMTIELYTDYQCPHCRAFYLEVLPELTKDYIKTGKVRLIHRDFRLSQMPYSKMATRYANAAGQIGRYDLVAKQIFETQPEWSQNGNLDAEIAKVLPPGEMQKVRDLVQNDPHLDDQTLKDEAMAINEDHLTATPTIVIVYKGKRETVSGASTWPLLKSYIDGKLGK